MVVECIPPLIELALSGKYSPMDFMIALRHCPTYNKEDAPYLERQVWGSDGLPIQLTGRD